MKKRHLYGLFLDDKEVFRGSAEDIKDKFGDIQTGIGWYAKYKYKLYKKYDVKYLGKCEISETKSKNMDKPRDTYEYLVEHLKIYGNTSLNNDKDVKTYVRRLRRNGIKCSYRKAIVREPAKRFRNPAKRNEQEYFWVIERSE